MVSLAGLAREARVREIVRSALPHRPARVLDVATGHGRFAQMLAAEGYDVVAFDARPDRIPWEDRRVSWHIADARELQSERWGKFQAVLLLGILYHLPRSGVQRTLEGAASVLTRGGIAIVDTHVWLGEEPWGLYREGTGPLSSIDGGQSFWPSEETLATMIVGAGFGALYKCLVPLEPEKPRNRITLVAHLPRETATTPLWDAQEPL